MHSTLTDATSDTPSLSSGSATGSLAFASGYFDLLAWPILARLAWGFIITAAVGPHVLLNWFLRSLRLPGGSRLTITGSDWLGWWECILLSLLGYATPLLARGVGSYRYASYLVITALATAVATPLVGRMFQHYTSHIALDGRLIFSFSRPYTDIYFRIFALMACSIFPPLMPLALLPLLRWLPKHFKGNGASFVFRRSLGEAALRLLAGMALLHALHPMADFLIDISDQGLEYRETLYWALYLAVMPVVLGWWLRWIVAAIEFRLYATAAPQHEKINPT